MKTVHTRLGRNAVAFLILLKDTRLEGIRDTRLEGKGNYGKRY